MNTLPDTPGIRALLAAIDRDEQPASPRYTCWQYRVIRGDMSDEPEVHGSYKHNIFCSTGNGYNWLAQQLAFGPTRQSSASTGTNTSASSTAINNTGAPWVAGANVGCIIVSCTTSSGGAMVYGICTANTTTSCTVDQWYSLTSASGAVGTTPATSSLYCILPVGAAATWIGLTGTVITPGAGDTTLTSELTANGFQRAPASITYVAAASTVLLSHLFSAGANQTISSEAEFCTAYVASGTSYMPFDNNIPTPPSLLTGDTITVNVTITL